MNILITGGAGYLGAAASEILLQAGHKVTVYDSLVTGHEAAIPAEAEFIHADLADREKLDAVLGGNGFDAVMHFAAFIEVGESVQQPLKYYRNNLSCTENLLSAMEIAGVEKFVFSSTAAVYGMPESLRERCWYF